MCRVPTATCCALSLLMVWTREIKWLVWSYTIPKLPLWERGGKKGKSKVSDWQVLSGTRRKNVFCAERMVIWSLKHWQEAVEGDLRAAASPLGSRLKKYSLFLARAVLVAQIAWEMLKLILRHEIYAQLVQWQADIMCLSAGPWSSFKMQLHTHNSNDHSRSLSGRHQHLALWHSCIIPRSPREIRTSPLVLTSLR